MGLAEVVGGLSNGLNFYMSHTPPDGVVVGRIADTTTVYEPCRTSAT